MADLETERQILGTALLVPSQIAPLLGQIDTTYFQAEMPWSGRHRMLWSAIVECLQESEEQEGFAFRVRANLMRRGIKGAVGEGYMIRLMSSVPVSAPTKWGQKLLTQVHS